MDYFKRAVNSLVENAEKLPDGTKLCPYCDDVVYKQDGRFRIHLEKKHKKTVEKMARDVAAHSLHIRVEQYKAKLIDSPKNKVKDLLEFIDSTCSKMKIETTYTLVWRAEELIKADYKVKILHELLDFLKSEDTTWEEKLSLVKKEQEKMKDRLVRQPPRHNSTSNMSNMEELIKYEVQCEMVAGEFGGYGEAIYYLETIVEDEVKIEQLKEEV